VEVDEADDDVASLLRFFFGIKIFSTTKREIGRLTEQATP
jgi:hypothetical protein